MIGKQISHYHILEKLGEGGMGIVYKAEDTKLKRTVALKFLPQELTRDPEAKARFIQEAQAVSALQHANICTLHDIVEILAGAGEPAEGQSFLVMDYYEGQTLQEKIARGPLPIEEVIDLGIQIASALQEAHTKGIIHRDIKPANIMITHQDQVKVLDFGLAKMAEQTGLTRKNTTLGTVTYMSPEQTQGEKVDHRTDIWSLGILLYEMLTGKPPFKGDYDQALIYSIVSEEPKPPTGLRTGVPMELERIIGKALLKNSAERYQHADDIIADLKHLQRQTTTQIESITPKRARQGKRLTTSHLIMIFGLIVVLASAFFIIRKISMPAIHPQEPMPVAVISFENQTGNSQYDYLMKAIPNLLITSLEQSEYLRVTTWERMMDLMRQTGEVLPPVIDRDLGFNLCRMDGARALVVGSFTKAGEQFATDIKVLDVDSKQILAAARTSGEGEASILRNQIDALSKEITRGIGLVSVDQKLTLKPIAEMTTRSMEAYSYFLLGREKYDNMDIIDAIRLLTRSIEYDSTFAIAYLYLGGAYAMRGNYAFRTSLCTQAYNLSRNATEKERMYIEAGYAELIERDQTKATAILEEMRDRFPREKQVHYQLGVKYVGAGKTNDAIAELQEAFHLDPTHGPSINQLAYIYMSLDNFPKALEYLHQYTKMFPAEPNPYDSMGDCYINMNEIDSALYYFKQAVMKKPDFYLSGYKIGIIYVWQQNYDDGLKWFQETMRQAEPTGGGLTFSSIICRFQGRNSLAETYFELAKQKWISQEAAHFIILLDIAKGWYLFEISDLEGAVNLANKTLQESKNQNPEIGARLRAWSTLLLAEIDILQGRFESAQNKIENMTDSLSTLGDWSESVFAYRLKWLQGQLSLAKGQADKTIALLAGLSLPKQPGLFGSDLAWYNLTSHYVSGQDVLARAYMKKGDLNKAAEEYERLTTFNPKKPELRFIHPLLHFRLGQVYESMGASKKALERYTKFLELWKHAEGDSPELQEARLKVQILRSAK
jgi:serine/threonine protein kinase/tetratricopeptide (TPR) repeat protein